MVNEFFSSGVNRWELALPASPSAIQALLSRSRLSLPTDYLEFLRQCNGGSGYLDIPPYYLRLWSAENLVDYNQDYQIAKLVPDFFGFGDAGGFEFYAFDIRVKQPGKVYSIPFLPMCESEAWLVADSFVKLLGHVVVDADESVIQT